MAAPEKSEFHDSALDGKVDHRVNEQPVIVALTQEEAGTVRAAFAPGESHAANLPVVSIEVAKNAETTGKIEAPPVSAEKADCKPNPVYETMINTALRTMYDASSLGKPEIALHKHDCEITDNASALSYADQTLHESNDRYNDVLSKAEVAKFSQGSDGKQIGLGVDLVPQGSDKSASGVVIDRVFPGGPADQAGLKSNDRIIAFNGEDVTGINKDVLGKKLMETGGKDFRITIERDGQKQEIVAHIGEYEVPAVRDMVLPGNVAYFRLKNFSQKDTTDELKAAILRHPEVNGLVIDLRSNPGGLLPESIRATTLFNDHANVVSISQRKDSDPGKPEYDERTLRAEPGSIMAVRKGEKPLWEYNGERDIVSKPVVVLTNGETASAAEIFAGALKDNGDAIIVGETTYGKGIGQSILFSAPDTGVALPEGGAVKVTSFRYYTPNGQWLGDGNNNRHGIEPNIVVHKDSPLTPGLTNDEQVNVALKYIEAVGKQNTPKS